MYSYAFLTVCIVPQKRFFLDVVSLDTVENETIATNDIPIKLDTKGIGLLGILCFTLKS